MPQYIYGKNTILARLQKGEDLEMVLTGPNFKDMRFTKYFEHVPVKIINEKELDKLADGGVHQGIVARIKTYEYASLENVLHRASQMPYPLLLMLDGIEDPHNLGAILRSCEAIGVSGVIVAKHRTAPLNATVAKVSTGAIEYVPVAQVTNLTQTIQKMKKMGYWIVGAEASNSQDYRAVDYKMPTLLIVGSEGKGISRLVLEQCDFKIRLPMVGEINSLNASVATAVLLYQIFDSRYPFVSSEEGSDSR